MPEPEPECEDNSTSAVSGSAGCGECGEARLLLVSGASYAECDGVYSLTNLTSVWDTKHIVYSRLAEGDNRSVNSLTVWKLHSSSDQIFQ